MNGFTGEGVYAGELGEFLPWLRAAEWTGIGRHTVWGFGAIRIVTAR
jgi:CRISPR/Cas system endoribonuclease Cas6 (RAMP superfamily)